MKQINGESQIFFILLECCCISASSTLVLFIVTTLEIGARLKSTCVLNVQNCACVTCKIVRGYTEIVYWSQRVCVTAYVQNIYRPVSYLIHEESNEPTITNHTTPLSLSLCVCVDGFLPVYSKYVLHRCKRLNCHLPISISY